VLLGPMSEPGRALAAGREEQVWADWLCGEHSPTHRRETLATFADPVSEAHEGDLVPMRLRLLSSVRVLGEGVDTPGCDSVFFGDVRGSAVDILQIVGRALRMKPGEGKVASLVVPVFLGPGEDPNAMLTSKGYQSLAKVLAALRSHDTDTIEQLAEQQATSRARKPSVAELAASGSAYGEGGPSAPAQSLLSFSTPRDPAVLAQFMKLRILRPENTYWRQGIQAATRYVKENGDLRVATPWRRSPELVPGLAGRLAALLPPVPDADHGRGPGAHPAGPDHAPGRRPRRMDPGATPRLGPTPARTAMDARTHAPHRADGT
jgi:hypothetical protein